jgi:hypothetical protein
LGDSCSLAEALRFWRYDSRTATAVGIDAARLAKKWFCRGIDLYEMTAEK